MFLGTLWSSIKQFKAHYVFDGEHGTALHAMQGNRASSRSEGKSHGFSRVADGTWGIFSCYSGNGPSKLLFVQRRQDSCLVTRDTSGISSMLGRAIQTLVEVKKETQCPFPGATVILGFLSIFKWSQASSPFEALNSTCLSWHQSHVRPPVEIRWGPRTISRVSTGNLDISSSCEMKAKPAFKPLQGNPTFFSVRASQFPFHLRHKIQGPSHIPIAERILFLTCLLKVGIPLESKPGNQLSSPDGLRFTELSLSFCAELGVPLDLG